MFKEKNTKKRIVSSDAKDNSTLDARHNNMINTMTLKQLRVKDLEQTQANINDKLSDLQAYIRKCKNQGDTDSSGYNAAWQKNLDLLDQSRKIAQEISESSSIDEEINYYENAGNILFQYYDLLDKQNETSDTYVPPVMARPTKGRKKLPPPPTITILDALSLNGTLDVGDHNNDQPSDSNVIVGTTNDTDTTSVKSKTKSKTTLVNEYLAVVDSACITNVSPDTLGMCPKCDTELACIQQEGAMVCVDCGYQELLLVEQNRPIIRQPCKDASHYSYKRINHYREWLSQVQGRESTDIPPEVFEQILQEIKKEKIHDTKKLTKAKMREILKKLKINRYYEHITYIINRINGVPAPYFSAELEDKLCSMFKEIQGPFLKHCPPSRKNFLSYSYVLRKLVQILGLEQYYNLFNTLKARTKLYAQDQIWREICKDLGWPMHASL